MTRSFLACLWVAAHHGLRRMGQRKEDTRHLWPWVFDVSAELGNPPAPGGPS